MSRREAARALAAATLGTAAAGPALVGSVGGLLLPRVADAGPLSMGPAIGATGAAAPGATSLIRIGSNENPSGLGPKAMAAFEGARPEVNRYPYDVNGRLVDRLSSLYSVSPDRILVTPGSGEILRAASVAFTSAAKSLVAASPTFETPGRAAQMVGATVHDVPVAANGSLDLPAMAARAEGAGLFFVCNPNNPTGGVSSAAAITEFIARVRRVNPDAVILIDEAYHDYVEDPAYATAVPLVANDPRIIVSRTFSKVHGMAGMRVGYAIGHPSTLAAMRRLTGNGMVSGLAAATALASIDDAEHIKAQRTANHEARAFTRQAFENAGFRVLPSEANFVMVDIKRSAAGFQAQCREANVIVARPFPPMDNYSRISIGTLPEMRRAVAALLPLLTAPASARAFREQAAAETLSASLSSTFAWAETGC